MKHKLLGLLVCLVVFGNHIHAQNFIAEYFFDQDPGIGNATNLAVIASVNGTLYDSADYSGNINIPTNLEHGKHHLCIRVGEVQLNGDVVWSHYQTRTLFVKQNLGSSIVLAEYFFDQDPGVGNGTPITMNPMIDSSDWTGNITTTGLSDGIHYLTVRAKDISGKWSLYTTRKMRVTSSGNGIVRLEYFYDQDPGIGNGTAIPIIGNLTSGEFTGTMNTTGLNAGKHLLYVRAKNAEGNWSMYEQRKVTILENGIAITDAEYFFDQDPGIGNGQPLPITAMSDSATYVGGINTTGLSEGKHRLSIRVKNVNGAWSIYESRKIDILNTAITGEYFFDTDPGIGNGTTFSLTSAGLNETEFSASLLSDANLLHGQHWLYVRTKSSNGDWGHYDSLGVYIDCNNPVIGQVVQSQGLNLCGEEGMQLTLVNSNLNEGTQWSWYSGSCGTTLEATGNSVFVAPNDTTTYYVRGEGGCTNIFTCLAVPVNYNPASHLDLRLFIEGYYAGSNSMQPVLSNEGQPTCAGITDTVEIDLVDPITQNVLHTEKALLHQNGKLRCNFFPYTGEYYLGVRHRNALETWSAIPITLTNEMVSYDFTTAASKAFGANMKEIEPNVWAFYSGDLNQDDVIDVFDYLILDPHIVLGVNGYYVSDINGDGSVDVFDYLVLSPNIQEGIGAFLPF